jgi:hypothetical protein
MNQEVQITLSRRHLYWIGGSTLALALLLTGVVVAANAGDREPGANGPVGPTIAVGAPSAPSTPGLSDGPSTSASGATVAPSTDRTGDIQCPAATITVTDAGSLKTALAQARPGSVIRLADGIYTDKFKATTPGTAEQPIYLCGRTGAILDGDGVKGGYAMHLDGASFWRLVGFTIRNGQKGLMADRVQRVVVQGLTVEQIGDEAIHLRNFSSDNLVQGNTIRNTGLRRDKFGEGIYIGTAESNWCTITNCQPDHSDRNIVRGNVISATTAESIDIKEGTSGGVVSGNTFDGSALSGSHADSWVDVKGNGWLIEGNVGRHALEDGYQTHEVVDGWGAKNTFKANRAEVHGPGYGFNFTKVNGNILTCDNTAAGAAKGLANVPCT